jgi:hypothetical protein
MKFGIFFSVLSVASVAKIIFLRLCASAFTLRFFPGGTSWTA